MAWRFEPGEELQSAFRRVALEEIAKVRAGLAVGEEGRARAVHEARQSFKRLRALARLARHSLGDDFATENQRWRDVGKLLSGLRDQHVLMESFEKAVAGCGDALPADAVEYLRQRLRAETAPPDADGKDKEAEVLHELDSAEKSIAALAWPRNDAALLAGLKGSQARLRWSWKKARKGFAPADLHRWRKRVKDQAAQLRLFRGVEPEALRMLRADAKEAAEYLGEEHDLWILSDSLRAQTCPVEVAAARDALIDAIETRRDELRTKAFALGEKASSQDAKAFAEAVCSAWAKGSARASKKSRRKKAGPAKAPVTSQPK